MNSVKRKVKGGLLGLVGYMLSPLSWWNDLFVNVPLAVAFAWIVSLFYPSAFGPAAVVGYWLTNLIGLILLHKGARDLLTNASPTSWRKEFIKDLLISLLYTLMIVLLVRWKIIQPLSNYFK